MTALASRYLERCQRQLMQLKFMEWAAEIQNVVRLTRAERLALKDRRIFLEAKIRILETAAQS